MSVLFRAPETRSTVRLPSWVQQGYGSAFSANAAMSVDEDQALAHDAWWACVTRISTDVGMMPVDAVQYAGNRRVVVDAPDVIAAPSLNVSALDWRVQVVEAWLSDQGNAWGLVTERNGAYAKRIELQNSSAVQYVMDGTRVRYYVNNVEEFLWPVGRLWHVPGYTRPGSSIGISPVMKHASTVARGLLAAKFGTDFFTDGGHPSAILSPESDPGAEAAKDLKAKFLGVLRGNREPLVLPRSITYTPIQVNPTDSQFLQTMQYTTEQICRIFGEDPADYGASGSGTALTYANRTDADLARIKRRQFWVTKLQDALSALCPPGVVVRVNTSASLMMTPKERHELHALRLKSKTTTVNEVRELEDEEGFGPEYDEPGIPGGYDSAPGDSANPVAGRSQILPASAPVVPQETRSAPDVHVHLGEGVQVELRQSELADAIGRMVDGQLTSADIASAVAAAVGAMPAAVVNVTTPDVTVNVPATPVQLTLDMPTPVINVAPAQVTVNMPEEADKPSGPQVKTVKLKVGDKTVTGTITETE